MMPMNDLKVPQCMLTISTIAGYGDKLVLASLLALCIMDWAHPSSPDSAQVANVII